MKLFNKTLGFLPLIWVCLIFCYVEVFAQSPIPDRVVVPLGHLIGVNSRPTDPASRLKHFSHVRSFHSWSNDVGFAPTTSAQCANYIDGPAKLWYQYQNSYSFGQNMDNFYSSIAGNSVATMKDIAPIMRGLNEFREETPFEQKPVCIDMSYNYNPVSDELANGLGNNTDDLDMTNGTTGNRTNFSIDVLPQSYREHSLNMTLFSARYGNSPLRSTYSGSPNYDPFHPLTCLMEGTMAKSCENTKCFNPYPTGLGMVNYVECYNEPEKTWRDRKVDIENNTTWYYIAPAEYAALVSADYDGHCKDEDFLVPCLPGEYESLHLGVKNVDPKMKFVLGGLWNWHGKYVEEMVEWFSENRDGMGCFEGNQSLPFDVVNYHHYSTQQSITVDFQDQYEDYINYSQAWGGGGATPEADQVKARCRQFRDNLIETAAEFKDKEFWFTEFGYDTKYGYWDAGEQKYQPWPTSVPNCGHAADAQTTQAQWLMRYILAIAGSQSVHRADIFEIRDAIDGSNGIYQSSGLVNRNFTPKRSWYYVLTLKNVLGDYIYVGDGTPGDPLQNIPAEPNDVVALNLPQGAPDPYVYKFAHKDNSNKVIYAIWSPEDCNLDYNEGITFQLLDNQGIERKLDKVSLIEVKEWEEHGIWSNWSSNIEYLGNGRNRINNLPVSGTPIFLVLDEERTSEIPNPVSGLAAGGVCCEDVQLSWSGGGKDVDHYRIYYMTDNGQALLDFTNPDILLYADNVAGNLTNFTVSGLPAGNFLFWVVPVNSEGHIPDESLLTGISVSAGACQFGGGAPCLYNLFGGQVSYGSVPPPSEIFQISSGCAQLSEIPTTYWESWDWQHNNPLNTRIEVDLGGPIRILRGYYNFIQCVGSVTIEYQDCCTTDPNDWKILTQLTGSNHKDWQTFSANTANPITKIRIYKNDYDAKLGGLLFCAEPSTCNEIIREEPNNQEVSIQVRRTGLTDAEISWSPILLNPDYPAIGNYNAYLIQYGKALTDAGGEDYPFEKYVIVDPTEANPSVRLNYLEPNTAYKAKLVIPNSIPYDASYVNPCGNVFIARQFDFATQSITHDRTKATLEEVKQQSAAPFLVYPNPSTGDFWLTFHTLGFSKLQVVELATGKLLQTISLNPLVYTHKIELSSVPNGIFALQAIGKNLRTQVVEVVKIRE